MEYKPSGLWARLWPLSQALASTHMCVWARVPNVWPLECFLDYLRKQQFQKNVIYDGRLMRKLNWTPWKEQERKTNWVSIPNVPQRWRQWPSAWTSVPLRLQRSAGPSTSESRTDLRPQESSLLDACITTGCLSCSQAVSYVHCSLASYATLSSNLARLP